MIGVCSECGDKTEVFSPRKHYRLCQDCIGPEKVDREDFGLAQQGDPNRRYSSRFVGVELETGSGARGLPFVREFLSKCKTWGYKEDCSLNDDGMELVSPPVSGSVIAKEIRKVYKVLNKHGVDMEDEQAGSHIHVDFGDIYSLLEKNTLARNRFIPWGKALADVVCKLEPSRAHNNYCSQGFGYREYCEQKDNLKISNYGYCAVALRHKTVEFRIWSVTPDPELTLARVEFSQKVVDYLKNTVENRTAGESYLVKEGFTCWSEATEKFCRLADFKPLAKLLKLTKKTVALLTQRCKLAESFQN
jgi:Putative amidoligase enzyme